MWEGCNRELAAQLLPKIYQLENLLIALLWHLLDLIKIVNWLLGKLKVENKSGIVLQFLRNYFTLS